MTKDDTFTPETLPPQEQAGGSIPPVLKVLLVDDQPIIAEALRRMLEDQPDIEFYAVADAGAALSAAIEFKPTVILQDLIMPDADGFELVAQFRKNHEIQNVPIVVLSSKEDPAAKAQSFAVGANDYLVKFPDKLELLARIRYHSTAHINHLQRDEAFRRLHESEQKLAMAYAELHKLAALDGLTGVANRRSFDEALETEWRRGLRSQQWLSVVMCDIDYFKHYNDTFGHPAGDLCLKKVAAVLTGTLKRPSDLAARYGGEEFALILPCTPIEGAMIIAEECRQQIEALAMSNPRLIAAPVVTMSIGVASMIPTKNASIMDLIQRADHALYEAKGNGRNRTFCAG